ncbi:MAG TPA: CBS domain-containing protein [Candidatus Saccharimonadales bacterium]
MDIFLLLVIALVLVVLLLAASVQPRQPTLSHFELKRRRELGESEAAHMARRDALFVDVVSLQRIIVSLSLVGLVASLIVRFDWAIGLPAAAVLALCYGAVARLSLLHRVAQRMYDRREAAIFRFVEKFHSTLRILRHPAKTARRDAGLHSRQELEHLITNATNVISPEEKSLLLHGLKFSDRYVHDIMTPRDHIDSIDGKEMLGPLVLDDLHKTGHSRFPVINKDLDHIIGVLYVQDLLSLDVKRSMTAEKAMEPRVLYINEKQSLPRALATFLRTHHHLLIVVNEQQETVGLLSLEDTIEALIGHKIIDQFDHHTT